MSNVMIFLKIFALSCSYRKQKISFMLRNIGPFLKHWIEHTNFKLFQLVLRSCSVVFLIAFKKSPSTWLGICACDPAGRYELKLVATCEISIIVDFYFQ